MSYLIKKDDKTNHIIFCEYELNGYKFKPKKNPGVELEVKEIIVANNNMINQILLAKFERQYQKLIDVALSIIDNGDEDHGETAFVLGEAEKLRGILINKYRKYLTVDRQKQLEKKLNGLENAVKKRMIENHYNFEINNKIGRGL